VFRPFDQVLPKMAFLLERSHRRNNRAKPGLSDLACYEQFLALAEMAVDGMTVVQGVDGSYVRSSLCWYNQEAYPQRVSAQPHA